MSTFIGRKHELKRLQRAVSKRKSSFIVVKGRRRIGKSRLLREFGQSFKHYYCFRGIVPDQSTTKQAQLNEFSRQFVEQLAAPRAEYDDWGDLFYALADRLPKSEVLLVFDEISWMGSKDPSFLAKIKDLWDTYLSKHTKLVFAICGSASAWIEKNIMSSAGFVGRVSFSLTLKELPLKDARQFWPKSISEYEILKLLAITGGVPKYLEEINPKQPAESNIKDLCFIEGGFFVEEFQQIFSDIFLRDSHYYERIVRELCNGPMELADIQGALGMTTSGRLSEYLLELELAGFLTRDFTWKLQTGDDSKLSRYRLKDNYLRFYLRYIDKNKDKIKRNQFRFKSVTLLPNWQGIMGLQFENLVLSNRVAIHKALQIDENDIINANPYYQRVTKSQKGCQIDYMIQTRFHCLYLVEIKFRQAKIGVSVIDEVEEKRKAIKLPRGMSVRTVLVHVNGVSNDLLEREYFANIVDMSELFLG